MSSSPDRQSLSKPPMIPAAIHHDGTAPRSRAERLGMLLILIGICLAITIPTVVVTGIFGQRSRPKGASSSARADAEPADALRARLLRSAATLMPGPAALTPEPIIVTVRPEHVNARAEKVARLAAQCGGTATLGVPTGSERHLFVDLPVTATAAFRLAVETNSPVDVAPAAVPVGNKDHIEVIIRPTGDDE